MLTEKKKRDDFMESVIDKFGTTMHEFMPPVSDEKEGTLTFTCSYCKKLRTCKLGSVITFRIENQLGRNTSGGYICPSCEKTNAAR